MLITKIDIKKLKLNKSNPRTISDDKFEKLVKSIKDFPKMLEVRPIVVDSDLVVLGGNMRLKACLAAGLAEVPIIKWSEIDEAERKEFIVKDNVGFGDWDWDFLTDNWEVELLTEWGLDILDSGDGSEGENPYSNKIEAPIYEPAEVKPDFIMSYNKSKYNELVEEINNSGVGEDEKEFLRLAATRHIEFNYKKVADIYAGSSAEMQRLMENSALVIIDFDRAIELGYVKITDGITEKRKEEYGDEE